jgi:hypothetical protein
MSSALLQEYEEGVRSLGAPRMQYYKILSLFSFENGSEIHFGDGLATFSASREQYDQIKEFVKEQKKWVRSTEAPVSELRMRIWWLQVKILEFSLFTNSEHRTMFPLMTIHPTQTDKE